LATWIEMSRDSFQAAKTLLDAGYVRSSISRAYYAVYCAVTSDLASRGVRFPYGWNNPSHEQLPELVLHNTTWPRSARYQINRALRRLRNAREDADYRPDVALEHRDAVEQLRAVSSVLRAMGIRDE
jgi:uncharacterized protein (UPF0332 family)